MALGVVFGSRTRQSAQRLTHGIGVCLKDRAKCSEIESWTAWGKFLPKFHQSYYDWLNSLTSLRKVLTLSVLLLGIPLGWVSIWVQERVQTRLLIALNRFLGRMLLLSYDPPFLFSSSLFPLFRDMRETWGNN